MRTEETNEALAGRAKAGDRDALAALYEQNRGLLALLLRRLAANPYSRERMTAAGVTEEDLMQEAFFAVADAAKRYDPARGAFSSFLPYAVKQMFFDSIRLRTARQRGDPLCKAGSLDVSLHAEEPDARTLSDTIPDEQAAQLFAEAENRIYTRQLRAALDQCLATIPEEEARAIRAGYSPKTAKQTGQENLTKPDLKAYIDEQLEQMHTQKTADAQLVTRGLRRLRTPSNRRRLEQYREEIISRHTTRATGFAAWKHHGSAPECAVEELERMGLLWSI